MVVESAFWGARRFSAQRPQIRRPHSSYQRVVQGKCPLHFLNLNGAVCSNTLFSNASALTSSLLFRGNSTCKILEHLVWSNTCGFQFWGPFARTNFLSALCGLPTKTLILKGFGAIWGKYLGPPKRRSNDHGSNAPFSALWSVFKKPNLAYIITPQMGQLGPDNHSTAYIYIYIYQHIVVVLISGPSLAFWGVIIWAKFAFLQNTVCQKNTIKVGVRHLFFENKIARANLRCYYLGPSWPFLSCSQLGPDNNTYLAQTITPQNTTEIPIFIVFFEHQPKLAKEMGKKNDDFSHFAKHRLIKKNGLLQLPFWPKIGVFQFWFFQPKTLMLNKKHNLKSGKAKIRKRDWKEKQDRKPPKKKIDEKKLQFNVLMLFLSWNKSKEERKGKKQRKTRNKKKAQKKDKKDKIKKRTREREEKRERDRERGIEKGGGQKRLRRKKGRHSKINKNALF